MARPAAAPARSWRRPAGLATLYALAIVGCWSRVEAPCWIWTLLLPLLPVSIVLFGFHRWRRACPLAAVASVGARLARRKRRAPPWLDRWSPVLALTLLLVALVVRHTMINGDHDCLGCALLVLAIAALVTNALLSGRAWCNYLCPIGVVERIYTDGNRIADAATSRCDRCSGCKPRCPDIDQERAYRASAQAAPTAIAYYAFPGLVLGFYAYYRLRHGEWSAYFDGAWAERPLDRELIFGPGFTFAPEIPAIVACGLTMTVASAASWALFGALERLLRRKLGDDPELRPRMLALAAFTAFNLFYLFAGQPALRHVPSIDRVVAFAVPVLSTVVLLRRWSTRTPSPKRPPGSESPCTKLTKPITR